MEWKLAPSQVFEVLLKEDCTGTNNNNIKKVFLAEKEDIQERQIKSASHWNAPRDIEDCPNIQHSWSQMSENHESWDLAKASNSSL